ncbi:hypothetical protein DM619_25390 [Escherichia coli]|nr:hypothetical protein [Escherichia coli]EFO3893028.1 hypothetical protein [Escherichia coli]EFO4237388.1 hypothetical protein [Escherichia coli]
MFTPTTETGKLWTKISLKSLWLSWLIYRYRFNHPEFPGECFFCELRLPDHNFQCMHSRRHMVQPFQ